MKLTKLQLRQIIREEIIDWQGKYNYDFKFKVGMLVKDINPDCPHQGSEGIITKVTPDDVTYTVRNNGKNYKIGNILTKTKDQLIPLSLKESVNESKQTAMYTQTFDKLLKKQTKGKLPTLKDFDRVFGLMRKRYKELESRKYESVNEVQKRQATDVAVKFDKAYLNFSREIRDIIKMVVRITGNRTDGKIFDKSYKKHLIPFNALFKSWYKGQQDNPHIKESDLGLTYKKGKTVKVKHKKSGKELVIVDKPNVRKEYEKIGFYAESVNEVSGVDLAKKVLKNKQHEKGIDLQTANLIVKIHKAYDKNPELQKKFEKIPLPKMKQLIMKYYG